MLDRLPFPFVRSLGVGFRLPLHIARGVCSTAGKRYFVVDHVPLTPRACTDLSRPRRLHLRGRRYCFGFSGVGFNSGVFAVAALGFEAAAAMTVLGCQKSAAP